MFSYTDYQLHLMMFSSILSDHAIYAIPAGDLAGKADDALQLIYSPLTGLSLMADVADMEDISGRLEKVVLGCAGPEEELASLYAPQKLQNLSARMTRPEQIRRLCILANQRCNFACSYCYSARGRDKTDYRFLQWVCTNRTAHRSGRQQLHRICRSKSCSKMRF